MEGASRACETRKEARLSRRRHSCTGGRPWVRNESGASQTRYRSDFKRTWVRLGERGRRDRLGARRGESLFSRNDPRSTTIDVSSASYLQRTEWNVRGSDATILFSIAPTLSGGSKRTVRS